MRTPPIRLVLIPSYNTGSVLLEKTVRAALQNWQPVWVVIDGSTDGSEKPLEELAASEPGLRLIIREKNGGKGAAVCTGVAAALSEGFTHALVMDADGQHPATSIVTLMEAAAENPETVIAGDPQFGPEAPALRVHGRKINNWWTDLESCWNGLGDTLFGMRVYPLEPLALVFRKTRWARRFDFDPEVAVRLFWMGLSPIRVPVPCRYISKDQGGVSHFRYVRDNLLLTFLHLRLVPEWLFLRLPLLLLRKIRAARKSTPVEERTIP